MNDLTVLDKTLIDIAPSFINTVSQYQWSLIPDSQLQAAKQALTKSDYIAKIACADPESVKDSLIKSAVLGLDLTEGKRQGWLLPRKNAKGKTVVCLQVGYKGVEAIHQRMGVIDRLVIRVVRENDNFEWCGDDQEKPIHNADWLAKEEDRGPIKGAFSITYFPDGNIQVVVASIESIFRDHRDKADSWKSYQAKVSQGEKAFPPPWVTFEQAMVEKTMAFIASKQWPANIRNEDTASKILETLHQTDISDYVTLNQGFTEKQQKIYLSYVHGDDPLGYALYAQYLRDKDLEAFVAVQGDYKNQIPRGGKGKEMDRLAELERAGEVIYSELIECLANGDGSTVREAIDELDEKTRATTSWLFDATLTGEQLSILGDAS